MLFQRQFQARLQRCPDLSESRGCGQEKQASAGIRGGWLPLLLVWMLLGAALLLNGFLAGRYFADDPLLGDVSLTLGSLILMLPILGLAARDVIRLEIHITGLAAVAVMAAFAQGDMLTAGLVSFFMLLAIVVETRTAEGAHASIEALIRLAPSVARRMRADGPEEEVGVAELRPGDRLRVRPGEVIPADGVVEEGQTTLNEATITGESLPVDKGVGADVFAGTVNLTGSLVLAVSKVGADTTLGRVRELILAAEKTRLPVMQIVDRYAGYYVPAVLMGAAIVWALTGELSRVIAILVVACPSALVMATPSAIVAALAAAARLGVLIKNVADLELVGRLNAFVFDKTGTLTTGQLGVARLAPAEGASPAEFLLPVASAERHSNHPTAQALVALAQEAGIVLADATDFTEQPGQGVSALVNGHRLLVGRESWLKQQRVTIPPAVADELAKNGNLSVILAASDGRYIGWLGLEDRIRDGAKACLDELAGLGIRRLAMVSGDRESVAKHVAETVGCREVMAQCLPQGKVDFVNRVKADGYRVAVVGDGINDAPALASGHIGMAMGAAGSEAAIHSASVILMNTDLRRLPFLVTLSRRTRSVIYQNMGIALAMMLAGWALSGMGRLSAVPAAVLQNIGALAVVFNSARLIRMGEGMEES